MVSLQAKAKHSPDLVKNLLLPASACVVKHITVAKAVALWNASVLEVDNGGPFLRLFNCEQHLRQTPSVMRTHEGQLNIHNSDLNQATLHPQNAMTSTARKPHDVIKVSLGCIQLTHLAIKAPHCATQGRLQVRQTAQVYSTTKANTVVQIAQVTCRDLALSLRDPSTALAILSAGFK